MLYKCDECGAILEQSDVIVKEWDEPRGEFWGMPCSEHMVELRCPLCNSEIWEEYIEEFDDEVEEEVIGV